MLTSSNQAHAGHVLRHQCLSHAGWSIEIEAGELPCTLRPVTKTETRSRHSPATERLMRASREIRRQVVKI